MTNDDGYEESFNTNELGLGIGGTGPEIQDVSYNLESELERLQTELDIAKAEILDLNFALSILKDYAIESGLDLTRIGFPEDQRPLEKKPTELTKEELAERNKLVRGTKHAVAKDAIPQPSYEELDRMYKDRLKQDKESSPQHASLVDMFMKAKQEPEQNTTLVTELLEKSEKTE